MNIRFDCGRAAPFLAPHEIEQQGAAVQAAHQLLHGGTGAGHQFCGWVDWPHRYDREEFSRIKAAAYRIRTEAEVLVVVGIGGSYHGARATIEALSHSFYNQLPAARRGGPQIFFAGKDISPVYLHDLLDMLQEKDFAINVISKSGTTTEPAIAFQILRDLLQQRYGKEGARRRIYATTDKARGALRRMAEEEGYERFVIPDEIGGRYAVLTAVGLLPIAVAGIDIDVLMAGAAEAMTGCAVPDLAANPAYQYAAARNSLLRKGKVIEMLVTYEPVLRATADWWKQLYGESEGKDGKGIFPASAEFSTDLHSMGQYIQDGMRILFETAVRVERPRADLMLTGDPTDLDGLNFLAGEGMNAVNARAFEGTLLAHTDGGVPNLVVTLPELNPYHYGEMLYFFEKACGISGYLLGVNPFDQPGVEAYKRNMFALLGKPGYEKEREALLRRLT